MKTGILSCAAIVSLTWAGAGCGQEHSAAGRFNGLGVAMGNLHRLSDAQTRSISAENFTGEKGKAGMALEGPAKGAARQLGRGWKISPYVIVKANSTFTLADISGSGAIQQIWMTPAPLDKTRWNIIRCYWDDEKDPSVEVPLGDFFACGWGKYCQINSLPVCVNPGSAFNCYWTMPFRKHAKITVENLDDHDMVLYYQINYTLTEDAGRRGLFPRPVPPREQAAGEKRLHDPRRRRRARGNTWGRIWPGKSTAPAGGAKAKSSSTSTATRSSRPSAARARKTTSAAPTASSNPRHRPLPDLQHAVHRPAPGLAAGRGRRARSAVRPLSLAHRRSGSLPEGLEGDDSGVGLAAEERDLALFAAGRRHCVGGLLVSDASAREVPAAAQQSGVGRWAV